MKYWNTILGLFISVAVIGLVLGNLDWDEVTGTFVNVNWGWMILAFIIYLINYMLRTLRFRILLGLKEIPFQQLLGLTNLYGMYLYLLPAKSGEISYPILLKRFLGISYSNSIGTLIAARFFDLVSIGLFLPFVLFSYWNELPSWIRFSGLVCFILIIGTGVVAYFFVNYFKERWLVNQIDESQAGIFSKVKVMVCRILQGLHSIQSRNIYWQIMVLTVTIWLCVQLNFFFIVVGLGYSVSFFQIIVVSIIMVPLTILPLQGYANLGSHEAGWVAALSLFNIPQDHSLNIAVNSHIVLLSFVLMLGFLGFLIHKWKSNRN